MTAAALLLSSLVMTQGAGAGHPTSELVGRWRGTSICTKADWNAACHDEEALYDFQEGVAPGHVLSKGYKIVNGKPEYMGDLDFAYDETAEGVGRRVLRPARSVALDFRSARGRTERPHQCFRRRCASAARFTSRDRRRGDVGLRR